MSRCLLFTTCLMAFSGYAASSYQDLKTFLQDKTGINYTLDISLMPQRGTPSGHITPWQTQYYGTANKTLFHSHEAGQLTWNMAYTAISYWNQNATVLGNQLGVVSTINDYPSPEKNFDQFSLTWTLPKAFNSLSITAGQFPIYNFDGTDYDSNQQSNFINFALSQNATFAYPTASLGGYVAWQPNSQWNMTGGIQNASNTVSTAISWHDFRQNKWTEFLSFSYTPTIANKAGSYNLLLYRQPWTQTQPLKSKGWSLNFQQALTDNTVLFSRISGVNHTSTGIKQSYAFGGVYLSPWNRKLDNIGVACAFNKLDKKTSVRAWENLLEVYYAFGVNDILTITPDVQFFLHPGNTTHKTATVLSLRANISL